MIKTQCKQTITHPAYGLGQVCVSPDRSPAYTILLDPLTPLLRKVVFTVHPCPPLCIPTLLCIPALPSAASPSPASFPPPPEPISLLTLKSTHPPFSCAYRYRGKSPAVTGDTLPKPRLPLSVEGLGKFFNLKSPLNNQELGTVLFPIGLLTVCLL